MIIRHAMLPIGWRNSAPIKNYCVLQVCSSGRREGEAGVEEVEDGDSQGHCWIV
jgi:hypothetical protein